MLDALPWLAVASIKNSLRSRYSRRVAFAGLSHLDQNHDRRIGMGTRQLFQRALLLERSLVSNALLAAGPGTFTAPFDCLIFH